MWDATHVQEKGERHYLRRRKQTARSNNLALGPEGRIFRAHSCQQRSTWRQLRTNVT